MLFSIKEINKKLITFTEYNQNSTFYRINESYNFNENKEYDLFISHSYNDKTIVNNLLKLLIEKYNFNYSFYIDWIEDKQLNRNDVTPETAKLLKRRMKSCKCLVYITSENHINSLWTKWELGFFDGLKNKVVILPISLSENPPDLYHGIEFLGVYPYIARQIENGELGIFYPGLNYCSDNFDNWLTGKIMKFIYPINKSDFK